MNERRYNDDATLRADGTEYECHADLRWWTEQVTAVAFGPSRTTVDDQGQWAGTLRLQSEADAMAVHFAEDLTVVIGGQAGSVMAVGNNGRVLRIKGNSTPPF